MEWVTTTGSTIDDAKERALDQLGVTHDDAEFEVLEEPKKGLFGRTRGEAKVRARIRPTQPRQKVDRRDRRREKGDSADKAAQQDKTPNAGQARGAGNAGARPRKPRAKKPTGAVDSSRDAVADQAGAPTPTPPRTARTRVSAATQSSSIHKEQHVDAHQVGEEARRFMTGLLEAFGVAGTVSVTEDGDDLELRVDGQELGLLVGPRGTTLQAVQDLARVASQRRLGDHDTRLRVDVGGYRERRKAALSKFAAQMADEVRSSGVARVLEPMSSADRKVIHDALSEAEGIATRSEGDDPYRRVVITPANG